MMARSSRHNQPTARAGNGVHHTSPLKARDKRNKKLVVGIGHAARHNALRANLKRLLANDPPAGPSSSEPHIEPDAEMTEWQDEPPPASPAPAPIAPIALPVPPPRKAASAHKKASTLWDELLPRLEGPYAAFRQDNYGRRSSVVPSSIHHGCIASCGTQIHAKVQCLYISHLELVDVSTCACMPIGVLLVQHGVFPTSPVKPRTGVSIELLEIYRALFERSCDAVTALAAALCTIYKQRGFHVLSTKNPGGRATDPFHAGLGNAVLWASNLRDRIQAKPRQRSRTLPDTLGSRTRTHARTLGSPDAPRPYFPETILNPTPPRLTPGRVHRILRERCPACFGLEEWGTPLQEGADVQFGADGCFSYRHLRSASDGPISYDPTYFLSKEKLAKTRERIAEARKKAPRQYTPAIPQDALNDCEESWEAANEKKRKADPKRYDASGVFVLTCRHSQVIFLCNIDTPGERQEYIVACLEEVSSLLPPQATILQAYDVGCVVDHSMNLFPILSPGLRERVSFIINAMHAFGHQWVCQLIYSLRLRKGAAMSDHEGVERFWSMIRRLIPLTRNQWNSRRIWTIDKHAAFINEEGRDGLGDWIDRQFYKSVVPKRNKALKWGEQKAAQTSKRSHAPKRLRRELDKVLGLQAQIDGVEKAIADAKQSITGGNASSDSLALLRRLEATHDTLNKQAEALYASLNLQDTFPNLTDLPLNFVRTLILARDLKITLRKRAVDSFYEWETLDRAVGGKREALGTKLHQATRKAISKRSPALLRLIAKFNNYCAQLEELRPPGCTIPIPTPLSTQLHGLRDGSALHEDVWITPSEGPAPRWLDDEDVRDGIRSLHRLDRCAEEEVRLGRERANLSTWLRQELAIVARAIETCTEDLLALPLRERLEHLNYLSLAWARALQPVAPSRHAATAANADARVAANVASVANANATAHAANASAASVGPVQISSVARPPVPPPQPVTIQLESEEVLFERSENSRQMTETEEPEELDEGIDSDADTDHRLLVEDVLGEQDEEEESSAVDDSSVQFEVEWDMQPNLPVDDSFLQVLEARNRLFAPIDPSLGQRVVVGVDGRPTHTIEVADLQRIATPTGRLNGFGLNGVAAALQSFIGHSTYGDTAGTVASAAACAVLSTYDLPRVRYKEGDDVLWKHVSPTRYWEKKLWLLPIHRPADVHWVFVAVFIQDQQLYFFDSLGERRGWRRDLRDVMILITRLVVLANRHGHTLHVSTEEDPWIARPLFRVGRPLQTNGYDCGVWVLMMMASLLRGYARAAVTEGQMGFIRRLLTDYVLTLPYA
ncbi:hypothetical protein MSAN_00974000 [Mycena sanguinolenta]|uniref:Ubiquitin-like protease family profile domain-containing protein n=1 Tax=Mycena sanguinolenta TaxID=230812 RepID=A0A8H6YU06_9AGAR|nr:hypothetical protein MSAN_00974000 [Mycena sanguinolenta]